MIRDPISISVILLAVVVVADSWAKRFKNSKIMRILPTPIWCYIPPSLLTTFGILPFQSIVYDWISKFVLPVCLILLLMTTDIDGLKKIGRSALTAMLGASATVLLGGIIVFFLFKNQLGPENWKLIGTLSASWVGGTTNELAVKEATGLSDALFAPLFIADITIVYVWMTFLMIVSSYQKKIDRMIHADSKIVEAFTIHTKNHEKSARQLNARSLILLLGTGVGLGIVSNFIGTHIPEIGMAINKNTWVIITVTTLGLAMAFTPFAKREEQNATTIGFFLFYFVLASTGAKAHLLVIVKAPFFLLVGFIWMFLHGIFFFLFGKMLRIPIALLATASQAALGGVVSAPIVASTYERELISVALILAIFGNAIGNYTGILLAQFLQLFSS